MARRGHIWSAFAVPLFWGVSLRLGGQNKKRDSWESFQMPIFRNPPKNAEKQAIQSTHSPYKAIVWGVPPSQILACLFNLGQKKDGTVKRFDLQITMNGGNVYNEGSRRNQLKLGHRMNTTTNTHHTQYLLINLEKRKKVGSTQTMPSVPFYSHSYFISTHKFAMRLSPFASTGRISRLYRGRTDYQAITRESSAKKEKVSKTHRISRGIFN